ncbi:flagellar assembly peptidoglycan hydrolase FlgJ [Paraglaciecola arctica]|uniref:Peptidoglycan hydrolase FlgJ n=1 Tax=Paraglaciecola arctica BSs20135 TaxID=493475 RepID=K6YRS8_9ALTE|nr:flagellar assembly peptidoglycan hydrolase FlgJ [Paraglaciecola arctica]GAC20852.1 flagellar protein FlgJ [Paraglaciecola arctica BSs20135]|tara:strand:- start:3320 stop:4273 length:954 start_codon:yes stop_codon:yes gene_type:complete
MDQSIVTQNPLELSRNANDIKGLDALRRAAQSGDSKALDEAAKQFEAIFVQMMLKSMRKAQDVMADKDSPFNSEQVKFYRDMHDTQIASDLASNGSIGLADIIVRQLGKTGDGYMPAGALRNDGNLSSINRNTIVSTQKAQDEVLGNQPIKTFQSFKTAAFDDAKSFIEQLYPVAQEAAAELGIDPKALLAQAAIETGWGQHMIHNTSGQNSHNLFGIKADRRWQGDRAMVKTIEFEQGVPATKRAPFRVYDSFADSMQDYVGFVKQNPRYEEAVKQSQSPQDYFTELQKAGYATDPDYANKVLSVLDGEQLKRYLP